MVKKNYETKVCSKRKEKKNFENKLQKQIKKSKRKKKHKT